MYIYIYIVDITRIPYYSLLSFTFLDCASLAQAMLCDEKHTLQVAPFCTW